jgi:pyridinium-3,5-biscarboxylic acid mononucleotide sulfurtransferase
MTGDFQTPLLERRPVPDTESLAGRLVEVVRGYGSCAVAFSAGVDSTVVAKAAKLALGDRAVAVTGVSASLAGGELDEARRLAALIGIRHEVLDTHELADPDYLKNAPDRCYHCKSELYDKIEPLAKRLGLAVIVNGANRDDLGDYRPGMASAAERLVRSPLVECGLGKAEVRGLAAYWELPIWDKPAMPCLSSRIAYGEEVTPERLAMIDKAERALRATGLRELRVRYHKGDLARIEVPADALEMLLREPLHSQLVAELKEAGFKFITLDLEGFRSGSQNLVLLQPRPTSP